VIFPFGNYLFDLNHDMVANSTFFGHFPLFMNLITFIGVSYLSSYKQFSHCFALRTMDDVTIFTFQPLLGPE